MYPEKPATTFWGAVKGLLGGYNIPSHDVVQQQCLNVYLRVHRRMLLNCEVTQIGSFTQSILPIFHQLLVSKVHYHNNDHIRKADGVTQV